LIDIGALLALGCRSRARIGIGVSEELLAETRSVLRSRGCSVELDGFESPGKLIGALAEGGVDAGVRGVMPSSSVLSEIRSHFGIEEIMRTAVMKDKRSRPFLLTPVGIDEGRDRNARLELARATISYLRPLGWELRIGVISRGRKEDVHRGDDIRASIEDGERITTALCSEGFDAEHYAILIEQAVKDRDLIIAPDGVSGNLIFRALHLVAGSEAYGAPVVNLDRVFVDTSRAKTDFSDAVMLAAGLVESFRGRAPSR